ncbi:MAG: hypothetical protein LBH00_08880 [Planctomycetaceae bacterium]|nr:hypothetical protein [Planctomycetaceae bacterium]
MNVRYSLAPNENHTARLTAKAVRCPIPVVADTPTDTLAGFTVKPVLRYYF